MRSPRSFVVAVAAAVLAAGTASGQKPIMPNPAAEAAPPIRLPSAPQLPTRSAAPAADTTPPPANAPTGTGRVAGSVISGETGRPVGGAQVGLLTDAGPTRFGTTTDLDGRFVLSNVPAGTYIVVVRYIGYQATRLPGTVVQRGATAVVSVSMRTAAASLRAVVTTTERARTTSSDAGLLAARKNAAAVSDGISSEQMSRAPNASAADAVVRVPGVSVVDGRFVVVRGLPERYNNVLLNGADLPSPEPTKRIVPLDIFPSSLLESVVTTKSGMPDRPGDFSGGSVEVKTKDFPEEFTAQVKISTSSNSLVTGVAGTYPQWSTQDWLLNGAATRRYPNPANYTTDTQIFQAIRSVWVPPVSAPRPTLGGAVSLGNSFDVLGNRFGFIGSLTYGSKRSRTPDRYFALVQFDGTPSRNFIINQNVTEGNLAGMFNMSYRLGSSIKLGFKNLLTREAEETATKTYGNSQDYGYLYGYQMKYVERTLWQSQWTGEHGFFGSRFEWQGTYSLAKRDEPDNRRALYTGDCAASACSIAYVQTIPIDNIRLLGDTVRSGGASWAIPFRLRRPEDSQIKIGALYRERKRGFTTDFVAYRATPGSTAPGYYYSLPPNQAFAPEMFPLLWSPDKRNDKGEPYIATETVGAAFGMLDLQPFSFLRVAGGARYEDWRLLLRADPFNTDLRGNRITRRSNADLLPSVNLTFKLGEKTNLRFSNFKGVSRPDTRELSADAYEAVVGECLQVGNPSLQRATTNNSDVRWEYFPSYTELWSIGVFEKRFNQPIVDVTYASGGNRCDNTVANAVSAKNRGVEVELRKDLDGLGRAWRGVALGLNVTRVSSTVIMPATLGKYPALPLAGQSPWLANGSLSYGSSKDRFSASLLANWFDDRVRSYGATSNDTTSKAAQVQNVFERGRTTIDAKVQIRVAGAAISISGKNLTNQAVEYYVIPIAKSLGVAAGQRARTGYYPLGYSIGTEVSFAY